MAVYIIKYSLSDKEMKSMKKVFIISIILSMFLSNIVYAEKVDIECNVINIDGSHANFMYNDVFY